MSNEPRRWALVGILVACAFGAFVGGLLTWHHEVMQYGGEQVQLIGCVESATVNCDIVNTSAWSELLGIPIGTLAIAAYGAVAILSGLGLLGRKGALPGLVVAGALAVLGSVFLGGISYFELHYLCAWCLRLYATNAVILILALLAGKPEWTVDRQVLAIALGGLAALLVGTVTIQKGYRASLLGEVPGGLEAKITAPLNGDPAGEAPTSTFTVTTEDQNQATFTLDADDAWKGNPNAKVAVVEFADLQCGYCKRTSSELARLYGAYGDRVLFVFKHFPMNPECNPGVKNKKHREACSAAAASVCAQEQGHFWEFHDLAFKNQHQLGEPYLRTYAGAIGLDLDQFDRCMADESTIAQVRHDAEVGRSLDVHGTPRIFIDGKLYRSGTSAEAMARAIEQALGNSTAEAAKLASTLRDRGAEVTPIPLDVPSMRRVVASGLEFQIDTFEAAIVDGKATVGKHQIPALRVSWFEAKAACEAAGKRMCTEEEWVSACQNARAVDDNQNGAFADDMIEGTAYPYGDFHDKARCWDDHETPPNATDPFRPVYTGEMPGCVTPTGVYDMTGNVEEWVGSDASAAALIGGAFDTSEDHARCYRRNDRFGAGYASVRTGFRCCAN